MRGEGVGVQVFRVDGKGGIVGFRGGDTGRALEGWKTPRGLTREVQTGILGVMRP